MAGDQRQSDKRQSGKSTAEDQSRALQRPTGNDKEPTAAKSADKKQDDSASDSSFESKHCSIKNLAKIDFKASLKKVLNQNDRVVYIPGQKIEIRFGRITGPEGGAVTFVLPLTSCLPSDATIRIYRGGDGHISFNLDQMFFGQDAGEENAAHTPSGPPNEAHDTSQDPVPVATNPSSDPTSLQQPNGTNEATKEAEEQGKEEDTPPVCKDVPGSNAPAFPTPAKVVAQKNPTSTPGADMGDRRKALQREEEKKKRRYLDEDEDEDDEGDEDKDEAAYGKPNPPPKPQEKEDPPYPGWRTWKTVGEGQKKFEEQLRKQREMKAAAEAKAQRESPVPRIPYCSPEELLNLYQPPSVVQGGPLNPRLPKSRGSWDGFMIRNHFPEKHKRDGPAAPHGSTLGSPTKKQKLDK